MIQALPQYLLFTFNEPTSFSSIEVTFQGGFASEVFIEAYYLIYSVLSFMEVRMESTSLL